jgi:hypothetical protein
MRIEELSHGVLTVTIFGNECEELASLLSNAARSDMNDPMRAETLSGFFLSAALVCRTHGMVNLSADVQEKLDGIVKRVNREE